MEIISAGPAFAVVMATLHRRCFGDTGSGGRPLAAEGPWDDKAFAELLVMPGAEGFLACQGDEAQGLLLVRQVLDESEILTLGVTPLWRRRGLAKSLLAHHALTARKAGVKRLLLEVAEDNHAAKRLYESAGFCVTGSRKDYYRSADGSASDALLYHRPL